VPVGVETFNWAATKEPLVSSIGFPEWAGIDLSWMNLSVYIPSSIS